MDEHTLLNAGLVDGGYWWLAVLEKGFAKFMQNYIALDGGWESIALRALTGMPVDRFRSDNMTAEEIVAKIAENNDGVMTAYCNTSAWVGYKVVNGYYTVLGADEEVGEITLHDPYDTNEPFNISGEIMKQTFPKFTISYYRTWIVTRLGMRTGSEGSQGGWWIDNAVDQKVVVTLDLIPA